MKSIYKYIDVFINHMFPLIAIAAFFILGIAFFAFGKDDFGITRLKEDPNNTPKKGIEISTSDPLVEQ